jgi:hypothetical protein
MLAVQLDPPTRAGLKVRRGCSPAPGRAARNGNVAEQHKPTSRVTKRPLSQWRHGSYQSGIGVLDFSDTENAREIAYADPAPLVPPQLGGDWSSFFYSGYIYQSDITRGLYVWKLDDRATCATRSSSRT